MRAKNSSYAWSLVNFKDSISDSRFMIFDVLIQHWSFNIILFAKNEPVILDVHFPCQCRSLLLFFFLYCLTFLDDSLKWWAISKISSFSSFLGESDNVFVHPFRWVFQDKAQSCYFPFLFLTFTNQSFEISTMYWSFCMLTFSFNLILRRGCER